MTSTALEVQRDRLGLRADCAKCFGLCCVALSFKASADFAVDKRAGTACHNLLTDFSCGIHRHLQQRGFGGCVTFDCLGAGQKVAQVMFKGRDWRLAPETAELMFQVLPVVRDLHRLLWFITEALERAPGTLDRDPLQWALEETKTLANSDPGELSWSEVEHHGRGVQVLLDQVSEAVRSEARSYPADPGHSGADLRGADLRGAHLFATDLRQADLRGADLMDTDLRGTNLTGANLTGAIFLLQAQLNAAQGSTSTLLSPPLVSPAQWTVPAGPAL